MNSVREQFWEDVDSGEVHIRDKWQFALKSDFLPQHGKAQNHAIEEFYLFIPSSLQINDTTYTKEQFYLDQTTLIRYKTPEFSFADLLNLQDEHSPLTRVLTLCSQTDTPEHREHLSDELKLLANVVRSTLRKESKRLLSLLQAARVISAASTDFVSSVQQLCADIYELREIFTRAQRTYLATWSDPVFYRQMLYIDEFLSDVITHYLTGLLENLRLTSHAHLLAADKALCQILIDEKHLSEAIANRAKAQHKGHGQAGEAMLYRANLLDKFVLDALLLTTNRLSLNQRYQHLIGALSAGVAILIYFSLFAWLGSVFVINSLPFMLIAAVFYILKDRIKEWLRAVSFQQASRLFPDYTTIIQPLEGKRRLGIMKESFSFIAQQQLPPEIRTARNAEFHAVLETFQRPESVLFYKRIIEINNPPRTADPRRQGLNIIFRFNIHRFLRQAGDPIETRLIIDVATRKLRTIHLPKVYHLNMIIKRTLVSEDQSPTIEFKKLRIIIDKDGIKRIEPLI